jgi:hypothetical protein
MSERITNEDVKSAFETLKEAADEAGVRDAENWNLYFGNSTEGYTCRITDRKGTRYLTENLGRSKREATAAMLHMAKGIDMALHPAPEPVRRSRRQITTGK